MKNIPIISFTVLTIILISCTGSRKDRPERRVEYTESKGFYIVTAVGASLKEAEKHAKGKLIEIGAGVWVKKQAVSVDAQLISFRISTHSEGFVEQFKVLSKKPVTGGIKIEARGKVSSGKLEKALEKKYRDIGKPRFMVIFTEMLEGKREKPGNTITEKKLIERFSRLKFIEKRLYRKKIAREAGKLIGSYENPTKQEIARDTAAELNAEILIVGSTKITSEQGDGDKKNIRAVIGYKVINVGTARILAAGTGTGEFSHKSIRSGAHRAVETAIGKIAPRLEKQIMDKWKAGTEISLTIQGLSCAEFNERKTKLYIKNIYGVQSVVIRSCSGVTNDCPYIFFIELKLRHSLTVHHSLRKCLRTQKLWVWFFVLQKPAAIL